jgi:hypothetical protein
MAAGRAASLRDGIAMAAEAIDGGAATRLLGRLRAAKSANDAARAAVEAAAAAQGLEATRA